MKPPPFQYHRPATLDEALALLASLDDARVLAGGQSLMPMLNMRLTEPAHIIDINRIAELAGIREVGDALEIGAMTRQRELEFSPLVAARCPLMHEALTYVGHRQTRNRGTIGGSLCHLDPTAELVSVAATYDATIDVAGPDGVREIAFRDFPLDYLTPAIEPTELVIRIRIPSWPAETGHAFVEYARRHGDYAIVSAAALLHLAPDGRIERAALTLGGLGPAPLRMTEVEASLVGAHPSPTLFAAAAEACRAIDVSDDPYVPASYRQRLSGSQSNKALTLAATRATAHASRERASA
jgi:carbon-monoxide dehydrogenase medium subunit